jgi:hypothetical protein
MDLPKHLDVSNVRTMTEGRSAKVGKPLLRREQTRDCGTRKVKKKANSKEAKPRPTKTYANSSPKLGKKGSQFRR